MAHRMYCDNKRATASWSGMPDFGNLTSRIDALCGRCSRPDARLLVEIEDLLAEGYVCALQGDHLTRRLRDRLDALTDAGTAPETLRSLAREQRLVAEATRDLRARLAVMRERWAELGSERLGLA